MSYKMVSEYGNAIYYVNTERERNEFLRRGYHEEKPEAAAPKRTQPKKGATKRVTKNDNQD